jgi:hypothetical protein
MAAAVAIGGGFLCMISLSGSIAYTMSGNAASNATTSSNASSNASSNTAPVVSPKAALIATGQAIQVAEVDTAASPPFTVPTGIVLSAAPSYTFSMDVNVAQTGPTWRVLMARGDGGGGDRRPTIFISGSDYGPGLPNRVHIIHKATEDLNRHIVTTFAATPGTYFNLTYVVTGGKLTTYINGVKDAAGEVSGTFTWGTGTPPWQWGGSSNGPIKVKNAYWFNKGLTDAEVTTLASPSSSTTSTFIPEPYNL